MSWNERYLNTGNSFQVIGKEAYVMRCDVTYLKSSKDLISDWMASHGISVRIKRKWVDLWLQNIKHTRVCIRKCHFRWIIYERAFKYSSRLLRPEKIFKLGRTPQNISFKWRNAKLERKHKKRRRKVKNEKITMDCKKNNTNICETHFRVDRERWSGWECHKFVFLFLFFL